MLQAEEFYSGRIVSADDHGGETIEGVSEFSAEEQLENAHQEAEAIIENAQLEAAEIVHETTLARLAELNAYHFQEISQSTETIVEIAIDAVRSIVGTCPEETLNRTMLKKAIEEFAASKEMVIHAASDLFPRLTLIVLGMKGATDRLNMKVEEDATLSDGKCMVTSDGRTYEIDAASQIEVFSHTLRELCARP